MANYDDENKPNDDKLWRPPHSETEKATENETGGANQKSLAPDEIATQEQRATSGLSQTSKDASDEESSNFYKPGKDKKGTSFRGRLKGKTAKRAAFGVGIFGGISLIALALIAAFIVGLLKIPDFAQHITEYEFARATRTLSELSDNVVEEKMAVDASANSTAYNSIEGSYDDLESGTTSDTLWTRLKNFTPEQTIKNLEANNDLSLNYTNRGVLLPPQLTSVTLNGEDIPVTPTTGLAGTLADKFIPGVKFSKDVSFSADFAPALEDALRENGVGPLIRGIVAQRIRQELGISLVAWTVGKYQGKNQEEADLQQDRDAVDDINEPPETSKTSQLNNAEQSAEDELDQTVQSNTALAAAESNGGNPQSVIQAVEKGADTGGLLGSVAGTVSSIYAIAMPVCIIYDGSLDSNGPTMNDQDAELTRTYYLVESAADQQKAGDTDAQAVGAMNNKIGNFSFSMPEQPANGVDINTSDYISPQASPSGDYTTLFSSLPGGGFADGVANHLCPIVTNPGVSIIIGGVNIAACVVTLGFTCAGEDAAEEGAKTIIGRLSGAVVDKLVDEEAANKAVAIGGIVQDSLSDMVSTGGKIAAATLLARMIVFDKANLSHDGLASYVPFDNDAGAGGTVAANELLRDQEFGEPLTNQELNQSNAADNGYLVSQTQSESAYQRYFAFSNADSLVSRFGTAVLADIHKPLLASVFSFVGNAFKSLAVIPQVLRLTSSKVVAATNCTTASCDYGVLQWGWTQQELNLIESDPSYGLLENESILDQNNTAVEQIAAKYSACYATDASATDPVDDSMDSATAQANINDTGTLEANGDIVRDTNGDPESGGYLCSPDNLGLNSVDPLAQDSISDNKMDLVFRWRLAMAYGTTLDGLAAEQNPS